MSSRIIFASGIFALLIIGTVVPQFALSQPALPNTINESAFDQPMLPNTTSQLAPTKFNTSQTNVAVANGSQIIVLPGTTAPSGVISEPSVIRDPGGDDVLPEIIGAPGTIIQDAKGDDTMEKDCFYAGQRYSPGSNVEMPKKGGGKMVRMCGSDGEWGAAY